MSAAEGDAWRADVCTRERLREICDTLDAISDELIALRAHGLLPPDFVDPKVPALAAMALRQRTIERGSRDRHRAAQLKKAERSDRLRLAREYLARKPGATTSEIVLAIARKRNEGIETVRKYLQRYPAWREKKLGQG